MTRRTAVLIGFLFQLVAVFAIFIPNVILQANGTVITLRTVPVDPRSIFRGDYVTLDYEVGQGAPVNWEYGKQVFVVLAQNGDVYERVRFAEMQPGLNPGEVCLRGGAQYQRIDFPDIGQYFVEEGTGHDFENATRAHRLLVDVVVNDKCRAAIKGVRLGPEVPDSELPSDQFPLRPIPAEPRPVPPGQ